MHKPTKFSAVLSLAFVALACSAASADTTPVGASRAEAREATVPDSQASQDEAVLYINQAAAGVAACRFELVVEGDTSEALNECGDSIRSLETAIRLIGALPQTRVPGR
jgi:hypothetical protein